MKNENLHSLLLYLGLILEGKANDERVPLSPAIVVSFSKNYD